MKRNKVTFRLNAKLARERWGLTNPPIFRELKELTVRHSLSIAAGDLQLLDGRLYITHSGLLAIAARSRCSGIETALQESVSDPNVGRWVFRATVFKRGSSRSFIGFGDADPSNTSLMVRGAEMRVAETRAVNRALRKAYGVGLTSVEEIGTFSSASPVRLKSAPANGSFHTNGHNGDPPRLRDQLCLLIRQFKLDANLVKSYAADFCGTDVISEASRESLESFVAHLKKSAEENHAALLCKLNSYAVRTEVDS